MTEGKNKIFIACLIILLLLSVGYSIFSESLTVGGTVSASSDMDVNISCSKGALNIFDSIKTQGGYEKDNCTINDKLISMEVSLNYPTALRYFTVTISNNSLIDIAIPVKDYKTDGDITVYNNDDSVYETAKFGTDEYNNLEEKLIKFSSEDVVFTDNNGNVLETSIIIKMDSTTNEQYYSLKSGESMNILYKATWINNEQVDYKVYSDKTMKSFVTFKIPYKQRTTNMVNED